MSSSLTLISAGAGSGKTYHITHLLKDELASGRVRPQAVIATTFTRKAASELIERVRSTLAEQGHFDLTAELCQSLIGTVNSVCGQLLSRYALHAGLSPRLRVLDEQASLLLFRQALDGAMSDDQIDRLNRLSERLGIEDWRREVQTLVNLARSNAIDPTRLAGFAKTNAEALLAFFPPQTGQDLTAQLLDAVQQGIRGISGNEDSTKTTADYLDLLQKVLPCLSAGLLPWSEWVKLSKEKAAKRSEPLAQAVRDVAIQFDTHPQLQEDLRQYLQEVFATACEALTIYQEDKNQRGLIDFVDQEHRVLHLLDLPEVAEDLRQEIDLLLVDEFQDTSPLQLAIFLKLIALVNKTVWVGDVKQAIYGFRGCDPELMKTVVANLRQMGGRLDILPYSYRSQPGLVKLTNALFVPAFSDILKAEEVALQPTRPAMDALAAVEFWSLPGRNVNLQSQALAGEVARLLEHRPHVSDKKTGQLRPLQPGDIAILCRTNDNVQLQAEALQQMGIPASIGRPGLLVTPEARLSLACLRRLHSPADSLASAEILLLCRPQPIEQILQDRMQWLASEEPARNWKTTGDQADPILAELQAQHHQLEVLAPAEALDLAIGIGDVEQHCHAWGPTPQKARQRLANLEQLRVLARQYEDFCGQSGLAATVAGLLLWLEQLAQAQQDCCASDAGTESVAILTHHGAKGLEWPLVILCDLHHLFDGGAWEMRALSGQESLDLRDPLADRFLHFWPWPFGKQKKGIAVADRVATSPVTLQAQARQQAEALRLLYVSMTRARDQLILALPEKHSSYAWLDLLQADWLKPADPVLTLPNGESVPASVRQCTPQADGRPAEQQRLNLSWFPGRVPHCRRPSRDLPPSALPVPARARIGRIETLGKRLAINGQPEMDQLGTLLHNLITAELSSPANTFTTTQIDHVLTQNQLRGVITCADAARIPQRLCDWLKKEFGATAFYPEWPLTCALSSGQRLSGWIDLLVDTPNGWLIVDHKSFPGAQSDWPQQALKYAGQLAGYRQAMLASSQKPVCGCWIHFCIGAGMVEVLSD